MKNLIIILLFLNFLNAAAQGTWIQKSSFPGTGREKAAAFSIGDNGYAGIGNNGGNYLSDFWEYSTTADQWTQKNDFTGAARTSAGCMSISGSGYIGGGAPASGFSSDFFEYNPGSGSWTQKTNFAGSARQDAVAFNVGNKGYLGTGRDASSYYKDFWEYDPSNDTWTQKADLPGRERKGAIGFGIGDKGYIGLGYSNVGDYRIEMYEYRGSNNSWRRLAEDFPGLSREYAVSFGVDAMGRGYVMCGYFAFSTYTTDCWEFNQLTEEWTQLPPFGGVGRSGAVGFAVNGVAYVGLGKDASGNYLTDFWSLQLPTGVAEINPDLIRISPSPVHDQLMINIDVDHAVFSLYDLSGKKINEVKIARGENVIPLTTLREGSYIYEIRNLSGNEVSSGKIMKVE